MMFTTNVLLDLPIFVAGKEHFESSKRQEAMARIATGNFDAVIVPTSLFEFLPVSDEYFNRFVEKQIAELDSEVRLAGDSRRTADLWENQLAHGSELRRYS